MILGIQQSKLYFFLLLFCEKLNHMHSKYSHRDTSYYCMICGVIFFPRNRRWMEEATVWWLWLATPICQEGGGSEGFHSADSVWNEPSPFKRVKEQLHRIAFNLLEFSLCFTSLVDCLRIECTINKLNLNNAHPYDVCFVFKTCRLPLISQCNSFHININT